MQSEVLLTSLTDYSLKFIGDHALKISMLWLCCMCPPY